MLIVSPLLLFLAMGGSRALYRATKEFYLYGGLVGQGKPVIVLGAGKAGANLVRELARSSEWRLVGLLDDDPVQARPRNLRPQGAGLDQRIAANWPQTLKTEYAIIAMPSASVDAQRRVATLCVRAGVRRWCCPRSRCSRKARRFCRACVRSISKICSGREPVKIDMPHVEALLQDRVVMVTGAGGSIGSELCRQILRFAGATGGLRSVRIRDVPAHRGVA